MGYISYQFESLSSRSGFNRALQHFNLVNDIVPEIEDLINIADVLNDYLLEEAMLSAQVIPIVNALLVDRYRYQVDSYNMVETISDFKPLLNNFTQITAVDIVLCYFHNEIGAIPINPKNEDHWLLVDSLKSHELITIYVGGYNRKVDAALTRDAIQLIPRILEGDSVKISPDLKKGEFTYSIDEVSVKKDKRSVNTGLRIKGEEGPDSRKEAIRLNQNNLKSKEIPTRKKKKLPPMYSIPVTNELFHNGNVEAWKKIIESYKAKYEGNDVYVFYDGERINDLNTLFKWGKVKHGSAILISVVGSEIKDVAKLQRYLKQGASHMFEAFLKFSPGTVLQLF